MPIFSVTGSIKNGMEMTVTNVQFIVYHILDNFNLFFISWISLGEFTQLVVLVFLKLDLIKISTPSN